MAVLYKSDIVAAQGVIGSMNVDLKMGDLTIPRKCIGQVWDGVRDKVTIIDSLISKCNKTNVQVKGMITDALNVLLDAMGEYTYLDSSELPALENEMISISNRISSINASNQKKKEGEMKASTADLASRLGEIEKLCKVLRELDNKYNRAQNMKSDVERFLHDLSNEVSSFTPTAPVSFEPISEQDVYFDKYNGNNGSDGSKSTVDETGGRKAEHKKNMEILRNKRNSENK